MILKDYHFHHSAPKLNSAFLGLEETFSVISSSKHDTLEESNFFEDLMKCKGVIGWKVKSDKDKSVPTRPQTGWRKHIDYWNLNAVTKENHFPLPFIDQILEMIDGYEFYHFLYGFRILSY